MSVSVCLRKKGTGQKRASLRLCAYFLSLSLSVVVGSDFVSESRSGELKGPSERRM